MDALMIFNFYFHVQRKYLTLIVQI